MIKVFYYIAQMKDWETCVKEQVDCINNAGLYDAVEKINVIVGGDKDIPFLDKKYEIIKHSKIEDFEFPALQSIYENANPVDKILYLHTKGVSRIGRINRLAGKKWRDYLMWGCVENWKDCVYALRKHDASGVQWTRLNKQYEKLCGTSKVFAGNFFWSTGEHIKKLSFPTTSKNRFLAEGWIAGCKPKVFDFHNLTNGLPITNKNTFYLSKFNRGTYDKNYVEQLPEKITENQIQKNCIYTVLIGRYETLKKAPKFTGWDAIAFVDNINTPANGWRLRELPLDDKLGAVRTSRLPRILPHKYLSDYDSSLYIDASIVIKKEPEKWIPQDAKWAAAKHWERATVWQEFDANVVNEKVHIETSKNQEIEYKNNGLMAKHIPLFQNCVLYRKHNDPKVIETCERWWYHFSRGTARDQLSSLMAFGDTDLIPTEITPRPKNSRGIHWTIYHEGTHRDIYRNFNLYLMIFNLRGSMISRGIQIGKCLFDRGVRNKVIMPAAIDEIKNSTVIVVKELNSYIKQLKRNNNAVIFDIVDNENVWKKGLGKYGKMIDAVIFPTKVLMIEWQEKGWLKNKHAVVIDHHGDTRFEPNIADSFKPICISTSTQIPQEVFDLSIDYIDERHAWEGLFEQTVKYNLHIGVYRNGIDCIHKPPSKLVTAAACNTNIILQRTPANIALMPEYPYYINEAKEIPTMLDKCKLDYEMQNQDWVDGLKIIAKIKEKTSGNIIASHYEKFLSSIKNCKKNEYVFSIVKKESTKKAVIVGAGLAGLTAARLLTDKGYKVKVYEKESHIGGACYTDEKNNHVFGTHIFHTNNKSVWDFVNQFTTFKKYNHEVYAETDVGLIPIPHNYFSELITGEISDKKILKLIFENYSLKQWGIPFSKLPADIQDRVKKRREGTDCRYFVDTWQGLPVDGYTEMFNQMTKDIEIEFNYEGNDWFNNDCLKIYTGSIDELFNCKLGSLPYRSLRFEKINEKLNHAVINDCRKNNNYTRTMDNRFFGGTDTYRDYPENYDKTNKRYYPIPFDEDAEKLKGKYLELAKKENIICLGRLGSYKYMNMDEVILQVMNKMEKL